MALQVVSRLAMSRRIFDLPSPARDHTVSWSGWKLCESLKEWRTDDDSSLPRCVIGGCVIHVGERYTISYPNAVACLPCSRITVRGTVQNVPKPPEVAP